MAHFRVAGKETPGRPKPSRASYLGPSAHVYWAMPSTMNESEFVVFIRAAFISFWDAVFSKAWAFSTLSNLIMTKRSGGVPSRLVNFVLRMTHSPPAAFISAAVALALSITPALKAVASFIFKMGMTR